MNTLIRKISQITLTAMLVMAFSFVVAPSVAAACADNEQEISVPVDQGGTKCIPKNEDSANLQDNPIYFYFKNFLYFFAGGVGFAVVGGYMAGAYLYITARGSSAQTEKGKTVILNTTLGLLLFIGMYAILQFLIPGGIFS